MEHLLGRRGRWRRGRRGRGRRGGEKRPKEGFADFKLILNSNVLQSSSLLYTRFNMDEQNQ